MSQKYHASASHGNHPPRVSAIITNDLFLAAFLHCTGCNLDHVEKNDRRRVSFVFTGSRVRELREAYRSRKVSLDMTAFRHSMNDMRRKMDEAQRSCGQDYSPYERSVSRVSTKGSFPAVPNR